MDQSQVFSLLKDMKISPEAFTKIGKMLSMSMDALSLIKEMHAAKNPNDQEKIREKLLESQKQLSGEYDKMLKEMGVAKQDMEDFVANPTNFTQQNWEAMQSFKTE